MGKLLVITLISIAQINDGGVIGFIIVLFLAMGIVLYKTLYQPYEAKLKQNELAREEAEIAASMARKEKNPFVYTAKELAVHQSTNPTVWKNHIAFKTAEAIFQKLCDKNEDPILLFDSLRHMNLIHENTLEKGTHAWDFYELVKSRLQKIFELEENRETWMRWISMDWRISTESQKLRCRDMVGKSIFAHFNLPVMVPQKTVHRTQKHSVSILESVPDAVEQVSIN